ASLTITGNVTLGSGPPTRGRLIVNGRLILEEGATITGAQNNGRLTIGSTGIYQLNYTTTPGTVYDAQWNPGSTLEISGYISNTTPPTGLNQAFTNFIWNCESQGTDFYFNGDEFTTIQGNFSVLS